MMMRNIMDAIIFVGFSSVCILVLISHSTQAASIGNIRSKRQSSASNVALQNAVVELERQSQLTDQQFVFDFINTLTGISNGTGGRTVAATVCAIDRYLHIHFALLFLG